MPNNIAPETAINPATAFLRLLTVLDTLRTQCPWDKKQTMETLRHLTIEETYELSDAILEGDMDEIKKELGDVMMHLVFYARIASEGDQFNIVDVLNSVCDKLISRHPHIYGDVEVLDEQDVKRNWEKLKLQEGNKSVLGCACWTTFPGQGQPHPGESTRCRLRLGKQRAGMGKG